MAKDYVQDYASGMLRQTELVKKQAILEIVQVAAQCETYEEFRKALYGMALTYLKEFEDEGLIKPGTVEKKTEQATDDGILF